MGYNLSIFLPTLKKVHSIGAEEQEDSKRRSSTIRTLEIIYTPLVSGPKLV